MVWLLVRVTAIMCGTEAHWCRQQSCLLALALRLAQLFSILASLISSPCRHTTQSAQHVSEHCRIRSTASGLHGRVVTVQAANHFEGHLEKPQIARCDPARFAAPSCGCCLRPAPLGSPGPLDCRHLHPILSTSDSVLGPVRFEIDVEWLWLCLYFVPCACT